LIIYNLWSRGVDRLVDYFRDSWSPFGALAADSNPKRYLYLPLGGGQSNINMEEVKQKGEKPKTKLIDHLRTWPFYFRENLFCAKIKIWI